ncbi:MAG TPA: hypothetical protein VGW34_07240 [Allosphingosinicella sp.]|nr:hypothetical protein [Allosphingosinicella sp.]
MARSNSPGYPNLSLPKAIAAIRKMFEADRRNPIDRITAAKHIGYSGQSGASDKALGSLAHYGLTEKTGKGELRVSQLAVDILHPDPTDPTSEARALWSAGMHPQVFKELRARFPGHVSEESLRSYLVREGFNNVAIPPVMNAFFETFRFLEQYKDFESGGAGVETGSESESPHQEEPVYGGAKVGDLVQWESGGTLQFETPMRIRGVSPDGQWVAIEGSKTGIPMGEVIVEERGAAVITPPVFEFAPTSEEKARPGETEWISNLVGRETKVRLLVSGGEMGAKEIGKLIKLLEAQRAVLADEDEDDG